MGIEEYVDLDIEEFQRRSRDRLLGLIEQSRAAIEADLGSSFSVVAKGIRVELLVGDRPVYVASTTSGGRLLLTDVSGRFDGRL